MGRGAPAELRLADGDATKRAASRMARISGAIYEPEARAIAISYLRVLMAASGKPSGYYARGCRAGAPGVRLGTTRLVC